MHTQTGFVSWTHGVVPPLLAPVDVYDFVLVDELEYVGRVHEDAHGPDGGDEEEDPELGPVHHHRDKLPVLSDLKWKKKKIINIVNLSSCF